MAAKKREQGSGGVAPPDKNKKKGTGGPKLPPFLSYDPAIDAERRALGRGAKDLKRDTRRSYKVNRQDFTQRQSDLESSRSRGMADFAEQLSEGLRDIGFRRTDLGTSAQRGRDDFATQLSGVIRGFDTLKGQQAQAANASGVMGGSTLRAAAARRRGNLKVARQPIDTGVQRLEEDYTRGLGRLDVTQSDLYGDINTGQQRLGEDVARDSLLAQRDFKRNKFDLRTKLQRGIREQRIGNLDLKNQAIFQARQLRPGAFNKYGAKKNK